MPARKKPEPVAPEVEDITTRVVQEIMQGRHNERLSEIIEACSLQILDDKARVSWWINIDGIDVKEEDLTLDESCDIEDQLGATWANLGPGAAARHAKTIIVTLYQSRLGLSEKDARERAGKLTRRMWSDGMGTYTAHPQPAAQS